jgi:hypothetical protein
MNRYISRITAGLFFSTAILLCAINLTAADPDKSAAAVKTIKILTIGNSFAENACHYLDSITESVPGYEIIISKANIGGCSLEKHATLIQQCEEDSTLKPYRQEFTLKEIIEQDEYDYVTIQQVSHQSFKPESFQPYADTLVSFIRRHAPDAKILIHQTWAYSKVCNRLSEWGLPREEMHRGLYKNYNNLAARYNIDLLPSGSAFYASYKKDPEIYLWSWGDGYHANQNGCYLAGCVWFGTLFDLSPKEIRYVPGEIGPKTAKHLRKIAAGEVKKLD